MKYLYRVKSNGRTVRICRSFDDLPPTSRPALNSYVSTTIQGRKGRVWIDLYRCEGVLYGIPKNGLEARNL